MASDERATAEKLLAEAIEALKALGDTKDDSLNEARNRLDQICIDLRRQLAKDATDRSGPEPNDPVCSDLPRIADRQADRGRPIKPIR